MVSRDGSFDEKKVEKVASGGPAARVESGCMLKFGFKSPFRVLQQVRSGAWADVPSGDVDSIWRA